MSMTTNSNFFSGDWQLQMSRTTEAFYRDLAQKALKHTKIVNPLIEAAKTSGRQLVCTPSTAAAVPGAMSIIKVISF